MQCVDVAVYSAQLHLACPHVVWVVSYERLILHGMARLQDRDGKDDHQIR
jgi:hypothetical protein